MNFNEIKDGIRNEYRFVGESVCDCGGKFMPSGQTLSYSEEEKAMVDVIFSKCQNCDKEKSFSFPIRSAYGQMMAAFMQRAKDLESKGFRMWSGHTILEGKPSSNFKEDYKLKLQCYKCDDIFEYDSKSGWRVACPKCDAS